jgi:hypothetical protein
LPLGKGIEDAEPEKPTQKRARTDDEGDADADEQQSKKKLSFM